MWLIACSFSTDPVLSQLSQDLKKSRKAAYATGTSKNHRTQWRTYLYFTLNFNFVSLPASLQTICLFCQFLSRSMTPPSVRNYLSGVKLLHLMLGFEFPDLSAHEFRITLRGIERLAQHRPHRAPPITPDLLSTLVSGGVDFEPSDVTFSCAFLFAFFCLHAFLTSSPSHLRLHMLQSISVFVVVMLSPLIMDYAFSLHGPKLFNLVSEF